MAELFREDLLTTAFSLIDNCIQVPSFEDEAAKAAANICKNNPDFVIANISQFMSCNPMSSHQSTTRYAITAVSWWA